MRLWSTLTLQIIACFAVSAAGLVPVVHQTRPFWGLYCISFNDGPPKVHQVASNSTAESAGLRVDDVIVSANGSAVTFASLTAVLNGLKPGESAQLRVQRGGAELDVTATGVNPPVAMICYPSPWHPAAGGIGLALGLLLIATQPVRPAPRWRAALIGAAGLALAASFFLAITRDNIFAYWQLRQYHNLNGGAKWHFQQNWVGLVASLAMAALGAWEFRGLLQHSTGDRHGVPGAPA